MLFPPPEATTITTTTSPPTNHDQYGFWLHHSVNNNTALNTALRQANAHIHKMLHAPSVTHVVITADAVDKIIADVDPHHTLVTPVWVIALLANKSPPRGSVLRQSQCPKAVASLSETTTTTTTMTIT